MKTSKIPEIQGRRGIAFPTVGMRLVKSRENGFPSPFSGLKPTRGPGLHWGYATFLFADSHTRGRGLLEPACDRLAWLFCCHRFAGEQAGRPQPFRCNSSVGDSTSLPGYESQLFEQNLRETPKRANCTERFYQTARKLANLIRESILIPRTPKAPDCRSRLEPHDLSIPRSGMKWQVKSCAGRGYEITKPL
jgi:hypothetical protein